MSWSEAQIAAAQRLHRDEHLSHSQIAKRLGKSSSAVNGLFYRLKHGRGVGKCKAPKRAQREPEAFFVVKNLEPAKYPFAPDDSCPDFAWDEAHCQAVLAHGGYPAFRFGKAA